MDTVTNYIKNYQWEHPVMMQIYQEALFTTVVLGLGDVYLRLIKRHESKGSWFGLHALGNLLVVLAAIPKSIEFVKDPFFHLTQPIPSHTTSVIIAVIHLYHVVFYFKYCNAADFFHHAAFVVTGVGLQVLIGSKVGYLSPFYHFFISGFPGGVDYFILFLQSFGKVSKEKRIRYAVELNSWIRSPGNAFVAAYSWLWFTQQAEITLYNIFIVSAMFFVSVGNGNYYMRQVLLAAGAKYKIE